MTSTEPEPRPQSEPTSGSLTESDVRGLLQSGELAGSWTLDPDRSKVRLTTRHTWGLLPLHGSFERVTGSGTVTPAGEVSGVLAVAGESISTKNPTRDKHLRSPAFFDIERHPEITFTIDSAAPARDGLRLTGQLSVAGNSRPATVDAKVSRAGDEVVLDGELPVDRREYGLTWNFLGIASHHSVIAVHAVFARA
jgi:polyisoprenoid-binding protein YceI